LSWYLLTQLSEDDNDGLTILIALSLALLLIIFCIIPFLIWTGMFEYWPIAFKEKYGVHPLIVWLLLNE